MVFRRPDNSRDPKLSSFSTRPARVPKLVKRLPFLSRILLLAAVLAAGFGSGWLGASTYNNTQPVATSTAARQQYIANESELIAEIAKDVGAGVASIDVKRQVNTPNPFGSGGTQSQESAGTGFIISTDGTIVTNRHVVPSGTSSVSVTLADGTRYDDVQVIGRTSASSTLDVAFLKITDLKGKKLSPLTLADSAKVQVGDRVIAIGNALGQFQNTVTSGIISGYGRDVTAGDQSGQEAEALIDLFQTDAAINAGNSGGPLVNINGEVIGINTALAGGAQNIGFAIPINDVKGLIATVLKKGKVEQPFLGVRYVSLTDNLAFEFDLKVESGAYIVPSSDGQASIVSGSPAEKAGLKEGDIIIKVNNLKIDDKTSLANALNRFQVGNTIKLTIVRDDKTITVEATLEAAPSD